MTLRDDWEAGDIFSPSDQNNIATEVNAKANSADLGTAAASDTGDFATAVQGAAADTAVQPGDLSAVATTGSYDDLSDKPALGDVLPDQTGHTDEWLNTDGSTAGWATITPSTVSGFDAAADARVAAAAGDYATAAQGVKADTATQPGDLGTAAAADVGDFASALQGTTADSAVQPGDLHAVASSGDYGALSNLPTLGTAAAAATGDFATAAQGGTADSAVQPGDLSTVATTGSYNNLLDTPTIPDEVADLDTTVTGTQLNAIKTKVDGIADGAEVNVQSDWTAGSGDAQILNKPSLGTAAAAATGDFATAAQGTAADSAVQDLSDLGITASSTELNYVDGVTSAIQTQLGTKASLTGAETLTNKTLTSPTLTTPVINTSASIAANTASGSLLNIDNTSTTGRSEVFLNEAASLKAYIQWRGSTSASIPNTLRVQTNSATNGDIVIGANGGSAVFIAGGQNGLVNNRVGIANGTPACALDVTGEIRSSTSGSNAASVVTVGGTQSLTNKTLTSPKSNILYDTNGAASLMLVPTAGAPVNYVAIRNRLTTGAAQIESTGGDSSVSLSLTTKGSGGIFLNPGGSGQVYTYNVPAVSMASAPASADASGKPGQIAQDGTYWYLCTAVDTWIRGTLAMATWGP